MSNPKIKEELEPIKFDPLRSDYTAQHRAGIAGLFLQIKAMEILREQSQTEEQKARFIIPEYKLTNDDRALWIHFSKDSFDSVMRERYRGKFVERIYGKKMKEGKTRKFLEKIDVGKGKSVFKFKYKELRPSFEYFEAFEAPEAWQEQIRDSTWSSYFCIPTMQPASFKIEKNDENKDITALWKGLTTKKLVGVKKTYCLNTWTEGLKGEEISESAEKVLLLHFWALASTIFTPTSLKIETNEQNRLDCKTEYHKPVIVVPDVTNVGKFTNQFCNSLKGLEHLAANKRRHHKLFISTPREAALQFFTPQLAQAQVITDSTVGARGAEVYTFKSAGQQAVISSLIDEQLDDYTRDEIISDYKAILKESKSFPYRALQVENLLSGRKWYDGFERLTEKFPHELFVPRDSSNESTEILKKQANFMAQSIRADFRKHMEETMNEKEPNVERMIHSIVRNYVHWRAHSKKNFSARNFDFDFKKLNKLRKKQKSNEQLTADEQRWLNILKDYIPAVQDTAEELFIRFRGRRDKKSFANLFTETFFRAFYGINASNMKTLGAFVEGNEWESAKRLVLMSISASAAINMYDGESDFDDFTDDNQENEEEEN